MIHSVDIGPALRASVRKLNPAALTGRPIILVIEACAALLLAALLLAVLRGGWPTAFEVQVDVWLWLTVLFATLAEAIAEARGRAHARSLRQAWPDTVAHRVKEGGRVQPVPSSQLQAGDVVICGAGETVPADGEVVDGVATVDESIITGESAPVIRESGTDRTAVSAGTRVLSDRLWIRITSKPGEMFLDRMIAITDTGGRLAAAPEMPLARLVTNMAALLACGMIAVLISRLIGRSVSGLLPTIAASLAILVCLLPITSSGLRSALEIAATDRLMQHRLLATTAGVVETAGKALTVLLDKTGEVTLGRRQAVGFLPAAGVSERELADAAQLSSLADVTSEGRSIVVLAKQAHGLRGRNLAGHQAMFVRPQASGGLSGVDIEGRALRTGNAGAVAEFIRRRGGRVPQEIAGLMEGITSAGGTALAVAESSRFLGLVHLKDVVEVSVRVRIAQLRAMGIRTVMVTADGPLSAAAIAADAGVDDFLAEATPTDKLDYIRKEQDAGRKVAVTGYASTDAPALAKADIGMAMGTGTTAARAAGNVIDLESNPTSLIDLVAMGRQFRTGRAALTAYSIASQASSVLAIMPAMFMASYPRLQMLNVLHLHSVADALLAVLILQALTMLALMPVAARGLPDALVGARWRFLPSIVASGAAGLIVPFPAIWMIAGILTFLHAG